MTNQSSDSQTDSPAREDSPKFERVMKSRHLIMLSLGGVIGTGLFFNSGYIISTTGPFGTVLAYLIGALVVYLVMLSLGELSVAMPYTGSFHLYASKFISPASGFAVAWLYWLTWTVGLGGSLTGAAMCMQYWLPDIPVWFWCLFFCVLILLMNVLTTRIFAEGEFLFSIIKVVTIQIFIILGLLAIFGVVPLTDGSPAPYFSNLTAAGFFPNGTLPILFTMVAVNFAFSGTELIGVAAGETENPEKVIPLAIKTTLIRLVVFFVGTIIVLSALIPMADAGVTKSPFVAVFERIGIPYTASIFNFVILTAVISAANSGLYASGRMVWSLAQQGLMPKCLLKQSRRGIPVNAIVFSMLGGWLALLTSVVSPDTVFVVLTALSGFAVVAVWMSISLAHINFRRWWVREGHRVDELKYRAPLFPWVPIFGLLLCAIACVGLLFDSEQRIALYCGVPFVVICYIVYPFIKKNADKKTKTEQEHINSSKRM